MVKHLVTAFLFTGTALFSIDIAYAADDSEYLDLGGLGRDYSYAWDVSADGQFITGYHTTISGPTRAFRWSSTSGTQDLGDLGGTNSYAYGVSADGSVVVGYSTLPGNTVYHAFRWTEVDNIMQDLGTLGGTTSSATGVSDDGSVVAGSSTITGNSANHAFRWTSSSNQMQDLGTLGGTRSLGEAVSGDGSTVVGESDTAGDAATHAFRWTLSDNTMHDLGTLGGRNSDARGVNSDGTVVVGNSLISGDNELHAFRWEASDGVMRDIGTLGGVASSARDVSADGSVVVGSSTVSGLGPNRAFRWTEATGMISVVDWLRSNGVTVASDNTDIAYGVSADGNVVVGITHSSTSFIARVSSLGSGIIDVNEFYASLANKPSANVGLNYAGTILNGAHGEPMRNLLQAGQQSLWVTSDIGYDNGSASDGAFGVADFGYGLGLEGGGTARFAFGGLYTDQDIDAGGNFINKGFYLAPELTLPVVGNLYATIGGYYAPGKLTVTRGYLNGGVMDYSMGEADLDTWAAKLRLDWLNAATINDWNLTPYASLTYAHSKLDAYSETGGGFPASFDAVKDHSTVVRAGVDGVHRLDNNIRLLARAEAAYRFEDETAATSGTITGLSGFNFAGQNTNQFWLRGGLGAEMDVAGGTASLNVNVTTQGDDPTVWIRSGWKVTF